MDNTQLMRIRPMDYVLSMTPEEHEKLLEQISKQSACSFSEASRMVSRNVKIAYLNASNC